MISESLEQRLERWERVLLLFVGIGLTLAASTFGFNWPYSFSIGWVTAWIILQLGAVSASLLILFSKAWRQLPLARRLNTAFGFLSTAWLGWLAIGFCVAVESPATFALIVFLGVILAVIYLLLRRANTDAPEEIFP